MKCSFGLPGYCAPLVKNMYVTVQYLQRENFCVYVRKIRKLAQNVCLNIRFWSTQNCVTLIPDMVK